MSAMGPHHGWNTDGVTVSERERGRGGNSIAFFNTSLPILEVGTVLF